MSNAFEILRHVTTATITTMLLKKGIRHCWIKGAMPLVPGGQRLVGKAFTLRFVPVREDLATPESWGKPISTRAAIEAMPEGCIAVADAMGVTTAGIFGDILVMRMARRKVTALVTDGVIRDKAGCLKANMPIFCQGTAAPASVNGLTFVGWSEPIACGGVAIFPDDVIVVDDDGARGEPGLGGFERDRGGEGEHRQDGNGSVSTGGGVCYRPVESSDPVAGGFAHQPQRPGRADGLRAGDGGQG
mgnify:CR=1 FL=1